MIVNKRILQIGTGLILLTMILCIGFTFYIRLDQPVFLKYCFEVPARFDQLTNNPVFQFEYIANSNDERTVVGISFVEAPDIYFSASEWQNFTGSMTFYNSSNSTIGNIIGKYSLRTVNVYMINNPKENWKGDLDLHTAQIQFSNGDTLATDIGRVILFKEEFSDDILSESFGSSFSNGSSYCSYTCENDLTLINIESPLLELVDDNLEIKFGNTDYNEISENIYKKGDTLTIKSQNKDAKREHEEYDFYDIKPKVNYRKEDGTTGSFRIYNITQRRYLGDFKDVLIYLKERGAF